MTTARSLRTILALGFIAGGIVLVGLAGWFAFWWFLTDYPEERFDMRVYAVRNAFYALVFLVGGITLRRSGGRSAGRCGSHSWAFSRLGSTTWASGCTTVRPSVSCVRRGSPNGSGRSTGHRSS